MDVETISRLFPADVEVCIASADMYHFDLFAEEAALIATSSPGRRAEFTAGRNAARAAFARIGAPARPILRNPQRAPLWPTGFVGSITHCDEFCCAVVARSSKFVSLGLDAETIDPLEDALVKLTCVPDELTHFSKLPEPPGTNWAKLVFSAKEAFHKFHNPLTGELLDFQDVSVRMSFGRSCNMGSFEAVIVKDRAGPPLRQRRMHGKWVIDEKRIYTGVSELAI